MKCEIREFRGGQFGEAQQIDEVDDLAGFEEYVELYTDEPDDEQARPCDGIVAARQWIDAANGREYSAFLYRE